MPSLMRKAQFDAEGDGYDLKTALDAGMKPYEGEGENKGHMGSVVEATPEEKKGFGLPSEAYLVLKGARHPTFQKAVEAEKARGFKIVKIGGRYWSVPDK